jgi:hypothetical protein
MASPSMLRIRDWQEVVRLVVVTFGPDEDKEALAG